MCFRYTTKRSRDGRTRTDGPVVPGHVGCRSPTSYLSVRTVGFEPTISWPPARRDTRLCHALQCCMTRVGFEPNLASLKDWQPHQKSNGPCARTLSVSGNTV